MLVVLGLYTPINSIELTGQVLEYRHPNSALPGGFLFMHSSSTMVTQAHNMKIMR